MTQTLTSKDILFCVLSSSHKHPPCHFPRSTPTPLCTSDKSGTPPNLLRRMQHEVYPHIVIGKDNLAFLGFLQDTGYQQRLYLAMDGRYVADGPA